MRMDVQNALRGHAALCEAVYNQNMKRLTVVLCARGGWGETGMRREQPANVRTVRGET